MENNQVTVHDIRYDNCNWWLHPRRVNHLKPGLISHWLQCRLTEGHDFLTLIPWLHSQLPSDLNKSVIYLPSMVLTILLCSLSTSPPSSWECHIKSPGRYINSGALSVLRAGNSPTPQKRQTHKKVANSVSVEDKYLLLEFWLLLPFPSLSEQWHFCVCCSRFDFLMVSAVTLTFPPHYLRHCSAHNIFFPNNCPSVCRWLFTTAVKSF